MTSSSTFSQIFRNMENGETLDSESLYKIAAEGSTLQYDASSGMYFDTGKDMYFDPESSIYYDYKNGNYYRLLDGNLLKIYTKKISEENEANTLKEETKEEKHEKEKEEGELDSSEPESTVPDQTESEIIEPDQTGSNQTEPVQNKNEASLSGKAVAYGAPGSGDNSGLAGRASAIRAIITKCRISSGLTVGDLHLITIDGYTIGSDLSNDLIALDLALFHCWINYDASNGIFTLYTTEPIGIISHPDYEEYYFQCENEIAIKHGMSIEFDYTIIELHLHQPGDLGQSETCDGCEPGLRKAEILRQTRLNFEEKSQNHLRQKEQIKQLCGIKRNSATHSELDPYRDRAKERRDKFGVDNPYAVDKAASISKAIPKSNKGRKLLEKSGWKDGEGLGKNKQGITEPIRQNVTRNPRDQTGIGIRQQIQKNSRNSDVKQKTINRYYSIPDPK